MLPGTWMENQRDPYSFQLHWKHTVEKTFIVGKWKSFKLMMEETFISKLLSELLKSTE